MSEIQRNVIHFAFVKSEFDRTGDITRGLVPLLGAVVYKRKGTLFSPQFFVKDLKAMFGIDMPVLAVNHFAPILVGEGLLVEQSKGGKGSPAVYSIPQDLPDPGSGEIFERFESLVKEFLQFAAKPLRAAKITIDSEELEQKFCQTMTKLEVVRTLHRPDRFVFDRKKSDSSNTLRLINNAPDEHLNTRESAVDYLIAEFVRKTISSGDEIKISILADLTAGALLSEVVLSLQEPPPSGRRLDDVTIVVDTPLVQDLLDLNAESRTESISRLVSDARALGAKFATFDHCVEELSANLRNALTNHHSQMLPYRGIERRMRSDSNVISRANAVLNNPEDKLSRLGIQVLTVSPNHDTRSQKAFGEQQVDELTGALGHWESVRNDANSIAETYRLRKRAFAKGSIFDSRFLFLTRNPRVSKGAHLHFVKQELMKEYETPLAMTDGHFAALCWSLAGGVGDELSKLRLVANCSEALEPRRDVVEKMFEILSELDERGHKELEALMTDERAAVRLMEESLGCYEILDGKDHEEILARLKEATVEEVTAVHVQELAAKDKEIEARDLVMATKEIELTNLSNRLADYSQNLEEAKSGNLDQVKACVTESKKFAKKLKFWIQLVELIILIAIGLFHVMRNEIWPEGPDLTYASIIVVSIVLITQFFKPISAKIVSRLQNRKFRKIIKFTAHPNIGSIEEAEELLKSLESNNRS